MSIIEDIRKNYKTVSIVGLAKNAGKTVTLNYLIEEAFKENVTIGLTSTGRDGESTDLVTNTEKPSIYAVENTLIATARRILDISEAKVEILQVTDIPTSLGTVVIAKVKQAGNIQIAGPTNTKDLKEVCNILADWGGELVLVDGAIDRKAASSPAITDACIIATGAVLSRDINKVIDITAFTVDCYKLSQVEEVAKRFFADNGKSCVVNKGFLNNCADCSSETKSFDLVSEKNGYFPIDTPTSINAGKVFTQYISENAEYVYVKGALTSAFLKDLAGNPFKKNFVLVIDDATKIFVDSKTWKEGKAKGIQVQVLNKINLIALSLNPTAPQGYYFDSADFYNKISTCIKDLAIIDVVANL